MADWSEVHSQLEHWIIEWQTTNLNFCSRACLSMHQRLQLLPANKVTRLNIDMHSILLFDLASIHLKNPRNFCPGLQATLASERGWLQPDLIHGY